MGEFSSRWLNWRPEETSDTARPKVDAVDGSGVAIPPTSRGAKSVKSTSGTFGTSIHRGSATPKSPSEPASTGSPDTADHPPEREDRFVWFRSEPYPGDVDKADPVDGRRVVEAVRERGGDPAIQGEHIVLRYFANMPDLATINDWVRANRLGVVAALTP